jgi:hypothetical protein
MHVPDKVQLSAQESATATVQRPSAGSQQEPSGRCGHEFGAQTPSRVQVPVQLVSLVTVHAPERTQQAPGGGHGFDAQDPPAVHTRPAAQPLE